MYNNNNLHEEIIIYTQAYNAENTIDRCIKSILNQTYENWTAYILDNGSNDSTAEIIQHYAFEDKRIIKLENTLNDIDAFKKYIPKLISRYNEHSWFTVLDADDEYSPDFFSKCLNAAASNEAAVIACGTEMILAGSKKVLAKRALNTDLKLTLPKDFNDNFIYYYQFMRTAWGKLYKFSLLKQCSPKYFKIISSSYGLDTAFTMEAFRCSSTIQILHGCLHKYYISPKSSSYKLYDGRIDSDCILFNAANAFLISKCGYVSKQNERFLSDVYFNALKDTFNVIVGAQMEPLEKMQNMRAMFTNETAAGRFKNGYGSGAVFESLRGTVFSWVMAQKICRRSEGAELASEILLSMYREWQQIIQPGSLCFYIRKMPEVLTFLAEKDYAKALERIQIYYKRHDKDEPALAEFEIYLYKVLNKSDAELFALFCDIKKDRRICSGKIDIDSEIYAVIGKYPLLNCLSADLAALFLRPVQHIMEGDYGKALDSFLSVTGVEINDDDAEKYIMFGQNLSAAAQNSSAYIYFKKMWISFLIDNSQNEAAEKELNEFLTVLPNDADFLGMKDKLAENKTN